MNSTSVSNQRSRLLAALVKAGANGVTTIEARRDLNLMMPATRVIELRQRGFQILTFRERTADEHGRLHAMVARYVLIGRPDQKGDMA